MSDVWLSLLPCLTVLALAVLTRRSLAALVAGCVVGCVLTDGTKFFPALTSSLLQVMHDETIGWIILVCGLFGSLIGVLAASGGVASFGNALGTLVGSRRGVLVASWLMGVAIFFDDYLNALTVGSTMRRPADRFGVSREMLAFVVDSTAAPICVLVPLSTWAAFVAGLLESNGLAAQGEGIRVYWTVIPYVLYAWVAAALPLLVALGMLPVFGPLRRAEAAARQIVEGTAASDSPRAVRATAAQPVEELTSVEARGPAILSFVIPLAALLAATVWFGNDVFQGVVVALPLAMASAWLLGGLPYARVAQAALEGFQNMLPALAIVVLSFVLKDVNDRLGLTEAVISAARPWLTKTLLPASAFVASSLITFTTGSFWGTYAVALPILVPLVKEADASLPLTLGALVSAGAFGSHACFYGDSTVLSAYGSGCDTVAHVVTQLPYAVAAALIALLGFLLLGMLS